MLVTPEMKIGEALCLDPRMAEALVRLAPDFERLRDPEARRAVAERATVEQAARMAHVPLSRALYLLNLLAGEDRARLSREIMRLRREDFEYHERDTRQRPRELLGLEDEDPLVHFVDAAPQGRGYVDPEDAALRAAESLSRGDEVILVRTPLDPVPLRDRMARRGLASWAEERRPGEWYVYFYRPHATAGAPAFRPAEGKEEKAKRAERAKKAAKTRAAAAGA